MPELPIPQEVESIAQAYLHVARADHPLVGIIKAIEPALLTAAEQILMSMDQQQPTAVTKRALTTINQDVAEAGATLGADVSHNPADMPQGSSLAGPAQDGLTPKDRETN